MGLLDELKKLTKPYDDEDYLEEDLAEPVRAPGRAADARSYASYAEAPRSAEPVQPTRRPYVFSNQRAARQQQAADPYAQQDYGYAQQAYAQQGYAPDPYARSGYAPDPYAQQGYAAPTRPQSGGAQPVLLVRRVYLRQPRDLALDAVCVRQALSGDDLSYSSAKNRESFVLFLCKHSSMTMPFVLSSLKFIFRLHPSV